MNGFIVEGQFAVEGRGTFAVWQTPEGTAVWVALADARGEPTPATRAGTRWADAHVVFARHLAARVDQAVRNRTVRGWGPVVLTHDDWSFRFRWDGGHLLVEDVRHGAVARLERASPVLELSPDSVAAPSVLDRVPELPLAAASAIAVVPRPSRRRFDWGDGAAAEAEPPPRERTDVRALRPRASLTGLESVRGEWLDEDLLQECS